MAPALDKDAVSVAAACAAVRRERVKCAQGRLATAQEAPPSEAGCAPTALRAALLDRRHAILEEWRRRIFRTYPHETANFYSREGDQFANPVGHAIVEQTRCILDALIDDADVGQLGSQLEALVKPRAIQGVPPSQAVEFAVSLRDTIREELRTVSPSLVTEADGRGVEDWLTGLTLHAFDIFCRCRETILEIRVNEIKRHVATLLRMHGSAGGAEARSR